MKLFLALAIIFVGSFSAGAVRFQDEENSDQVSAHDAMEILNKGDKLHMKFAKGEATDAEKKKVLDLYIHMSEQKPPKGDEAEWKKQLQPIITAAAKVVVGRDGAESEYTNAANCMACHKKFKP